jgi:hypothetical protein
MSVSEPHTNRAVADRVPARIALRAATLYLLLDGMWTRMYRFVLIDPWCGNSPRWTLGGRALIGKLLRLIDAPLAIRTHITRHFNPRGFFMSITGLRHLSLLPHQDTRLESTNLPGRGDHCCEHGQRDHCGGNPVRPPGVGTESCYYSPQEPGRSKSR